MTTTTMMMCADGETESLLQRDAGSGRQLCARSDQDGRRAARLDVGHADRADHQLQRAADRRPQSRRRQAQTARRQYRQHARTRSYAHARTHAHLVSAFFRAHRSTLRQNK